MLHTFQSPRKFYKEEFASVTGEETEAQVEWAVEGCTERGWGSWGASPGLLPPNLWCPHADPSWHKRETQTVLQSGPPRFPRRPQQGHGLLFFPVLIILPFAPGSCCAQAMRRLYLYPSFLLTGALRGLAGLPPMITGDRGAER